jgi:two-component system, NarL family, response regulator DevR
MNPEQATKAEIMSNIRVLIVDDHPIVCSGIRNNLEPRVGIEVVGEAHTGAEALQMIEQTQPDVVLLDMKLPDIGGVEIIKRIYRSGSKARVLGLSSYNDREFISQLLNHGASGYLLKEEVPDLIVDAVRGVAQGESGWVSRKVAAMLGEILSKDKNVGLELKPREKEVLRLVVEGKTNDQIGVTLNISVKTVENNLHTIYQKLDVVSRVEAAVRAVRESLV